MTYFALHALQHRGQESAGIAVGDGSTVLVRKDEGLVSQVFSDADIASLKGDLAIGHVRYGTAGGRGWQGARAAPLHHWRRDASPWPTMARS